MPRPNEYGAALHEVFRTTDAPLTIAEAADRVGASTKRAYAWVNAHRSELVNYGKQGQSATYMTRRQPS